MTQRESDDDRDYPDGSVGRYVRERWGAVPARATRPYVAPVEPTPEPEPEPEPPTRLPAVESTGPVRPPLDPFSTGPVRPIRLPEDEPHSDPLPRVDVPAVPPPTPPTPPAPRAPETARTPPRGAARWTE